jgi:hypothetical protein
VETVVGYDSGWRRLLIDWLVWFFWKVASCLWPQFSFFNIGWISGFYLFLVFDDLTIAIGLLIKMPIYSFIYRR